MSLDLGEVILLHMRSSLSTICRVMSKRKEPRFFIDLYSKANVTLPHSSLEEFSYKLIDAIPETARGFNYLLTKLSVRIIDPMAISVRFIGSDEFKFGTYDPLYLSQGMGFEAWFVNVPEEVKESATFELTIKPQHTHTARLEILAEKYGLIELERLRELTDPIEAMIEAGKRKMKFVMTLYPVPFSFTDYLTQAFSIGKDITTTNEDQVVVSAPETIGKLTWFKFIRVKILGLTNTSTSDATVELKDKASVDGTASGKKFTLKLPANSSIFLRLEETPLDFYKTLYVKTDQPVSILVAGEYW